MKKVFMTAIFIIAILLVIRKLKVSKAIVKQNQGIKFNKMTTDQFKKMLLPSAMAIEKKTGIPHLFILAQIALETAFGKSELFYKYFNVGGIRSFKPESEPHGMYWTWEHVKKTDLSKWDKYERDKSKDAVLTDKNGTPTGKIKIRVKLPFRHFPDLISGLQFYVNRVLLNRYFKQYAEMAKGDAFKYAELLQSRTNDVPQYATDTNYVPKIHNLIKQFA